MTTVQTRAGWLLPTPFGRFEMDPLRPLKDLAVLHAWMNDPEVAAFWDLAGPREVLDRHIAAAAVLGALRALPRPAGRRGDELLGGLQGGPGPAGRVLLGPARGRRHPLLIGPGSYPRTRGRLHADPRGRRLGAVPDRAPRACVAEPDLRNQRSIRAFTNAGFEPRGVLNLPEKQAMLMVYDRILIPETRRAG